MRRIIVALIATLSAFLLTATTAPANADDTAERALPARPVTISIKQTDSTTSGVKVAITGKATAWKGKPVYLQKRKSGSWRNVDKTRTNRFTKYRFTRSLPTGTHKFRVKVPKGNGYRLSYSPIAGGTVS